MMEFCRIRGKVEDREVCISVSYQRVAGAFPHVAMAFAFCSPQDQFSRKLGRTIAEGRFKADKVLFYKVQDSEKLLSLWDKEAAIRCLLYYLDNEETIQFGGYHFPHWLKDFASEWLCSKISNCLAYVEIAQ